MNEQEITGALADGGHYRVTSYMVQLGDAAGTPTQEIDRRELRGVERKGTEVRLRQRKGGDVVVRAASLDDAGRLEAALRPTAAPAAVAVTPAKKGGFGRKLMLGCGGLIGLVVVVAIIAVAAGGGSDKATKEPTQAAGGQQQAANAPAASRANEATLAEGQSATAEGLKLTLLQIQDPYVSTNQFSRPATGNRFVAFKVQIENVGSREASANAFNFKLLDADNFQRQVTSVVFSEQSLLDQAQSLGGGAKIEGWVGFEVKEGVALKQLTYDPNPFTQTDHIFRAP